MFTITTELTKADAPQILKLARANYVDLIFKHVKPNGPTSSLCLALIEVEVREYVNDALTKCHGLPVSVVLAKDTNSKVIGFAIVIGGKKSTNCGINYAAVQKDHRRQGILRAMLDNVKARYQSINLTCNLDKVPYYEALGFRVTGAQQVQVVMSWGPEMVETDMLVLGLDDHVEIREAQAIFSRVHGNKARGMINKIYEMQKQRTAEVEAFVREVGVSGKTVIPELLQWNGSQKITDPLAEPRD
ncbi:MAG: GNAT family N-acetyltransferase [Dehalococcoidia bacterium]|uniref:GNAT family N-acetyltransferase n=1 Tax=unclassified Pseudomonas TaxID=196821 RepID=UPI00147633F9|nr:MULTISPECIES: GNAT family N-acetyltransferase [unclassified Pseudomonas]NMX92624.1 GNAT family N-acetyltransferase [Pseudomonas sp. WS 5086]NMY47098.1 GNAT family N-acetyltransferase [Pseudomonas sp. WS 5027]